MKRLLIFLLTVLLLMLVACGGDDGSSDNVNTTGETGNKVTVEASNFEFDHEEYEANAGEVTVELVNKEGMHGITIDGVDGFEIQNDGSTPVTLDPGEYTIRCSVICGPGHADMISTLVVK
ncbi:hypothetical protein [Tenuibacillus multivorans]|uniref:Cytochrome c oxidase subunit 2 n=1 Tax=Tenuibacillus multivorans TaxID=237069 RepID=A0A1H0B2V1_9BACI|nr:hypothetical protein [Tenuibacillus multivorans]GEL77553.1 hypothetical protein TMU01_17880 [Tenuibacillus multivorans]SDN39964.1 hypothetical protein SAMN05216498_2194 [Tenuibacillus multivorans]